MPPLSATAGVADTEQAWVALPFLLPLLVGHGLKELLALFAYRFQTLRVGVQRQCAVVMAQRVGLAVEAKQLEAYQMVGLCVIGIVRNHLLRRRQPLRIPSLVYQHHGNVPHRDLVLRVQPQRLTVARERLLLVALL